MRHPYGIGGGDFGFRLVDIASVDAGTVSAVVIRTGTLTIHEAEGGAQVTDLRGADGSTQITTVPVAADGTFRFYGPPDWTRPLYIQTDAGAWVALFPSNLPDLVADQAEGIVAAQQTANDAKALAEQNTGGGITELPTAVDSYPPELIATIVWTGTEWPVRSTVTTDPNRVVIWVGNPGGASPGDEMLDDDIWTQG